MDLLSEFLNLVESISESPSLWREEPIGLIDFFKEMGETPYPGPQTTLLNDLEKIIMYKFTQDPAYCPAKLREVLDAIIMYGKGSGKDFILSGVMAWVCRLLCTLTNAQRTFGFGNLENIDVVNVAPNSYMAQNVFFKKLKARLASAKWFKKVSREPRAYNEYQPMKNQVRFFNNITAHSTHAEGDSFEGFNVLFALFDEIAAIPVEQADHIFNTLRTSATTRFGDRMMTIMISFPRYARDPIFSRYKDAEDRRDRTVYRMKNASWEVNPSIKKEHLAKDYENDPVGAAMKFECIPPATEAGFFEFPEKIDVVVQIGRKSQQPGLVIQNKTTTRTLQNGEERHFIGIELLNLQLDSSKIYFIGGDGAIKKDSYVLSLFHAEPVQVSVVENGEMVQKWVNKPVEDLLLIWKPSIKDRMPVDMFNISSVIEEICTKVHVKAALFDQYNSADVIQKLISLGVEAEDKNFSNPFQMKIYRNLKSLVYSENIELLDVDNEYLDVKPNEELKKLMLINGNKIDHPVGGSKDCSDARAAAVWICSSADPEPDTNFAMPAIFGAKRGIY